MGRDSERGNSRLVRDPFTATHWNGRDIALTVSPGLPGGRSVGELARELFRRELQPEEWADLVGAPDEATVHVAVARLWHRVSRVL